MKRRAREKRRAITSNFIREATWPRPSQTPRASRHSRRVPDRHIWQAPGLGGALLLLCLLRCLRGDKIIPAIIHYVQGYLGDYFVSPPPFNLAECYAESSVISSRLVHARS